MSNPYPYYESIVSDTSPLISLEKVEGGYDLARKMYRKVLIPEHVGVELGRYFKITGQEYLEKFSASDFIEIVSITVNNSLAGILGERIHKGEAEAITLAHSLKSPLLIDEDQGRTVAQSNGIETEFITAHILKAYKDKLISKAHLVDNVLEVFVRSGRISRNLCNQIISKL